jgi:hypothetical protein
LYVKQFNLLCKIVKNITSIKKSVKQINISFCFILRSIYEPSIQLLYVYSPWDGISDMSVWLGDDVYSFKRDIVIGDVLCKFLSGKWEVMMIARMLNNETSIPIPYIYSVPPSNLL